MRAADDTTSTKRAPNSAPPRTGRGRAARRCFGWSRCRNHRAVDVPDTASVSALHSSCGSCSAGSAFTTRIVVAI